MSPGGSPSVLPGPPARDVSHVSSCRLTLPGANSPSWALSLPGWRFLGLGHT